MESSFGSTGDLIMVTAMRMTPFILVGLLGWLFVRSEFWRALTHRLQAGTNTDATVASLAGEMDQVRRELAEVQERLDFAERLLARGDPIDSTPPAVGEHTPTPPEVAAAVRP